MDLTTVVYEAEGAVGLVRLNRPERMNAVNEQMYLDLRAVLDEARERSEVRALVLTGSVREGPEGPKQAFCAGADLKQHAAGERSAAERRAYIELAHETVRRMRELPKPIVAAVNGPARGAGAELALACDLILMAKDATLAFPETGLGSFVGGAATQTLARLVGEMRAKRLVFTGKVIDGRMAEDMGLVLSSHSADRLLPAALELASELAEKAPLSMAFAKDLVQRAPGRDLEAVLAAETEAILACMETEDWAEGIRSFGEKRKPRFSGR